jgi:ABC-type Zn uptake system ZnuABC Zn-binding protein ZnuA
MRSLRSETLMAGVLLAAVSAAAQAPVRIVVSIEPLRSLTEQLGGGRVAVVTLLPPGADPHTFEPAPGDVARLSGARLFVRVGGGLEQWAERLLRAAPPGLRSLTLLELPAVRTLDMEGHHHDEANEGEGRGHEHGGPDPHFWTDPLRVRDALLPALADELSWLDPPGEPVYRREAARLHESLTELDAEIRRTLGDARGQGFIAFHNSWSYFADRYGLERLAVVETHADLPPTAYHLAEVVRMARRSGARALLVEPQQSLRVARAIAGEIGATLVHVDAFGDPQSAERSSYERLMLFNARAFAAALGPGLAP